MDSRFQATIPIMRIFDVSRAKDFYTGFLGFSVDWEHRADEKSPAYLQVSSRGMVLHLTEHHGDCCPGATVFVWMTGIDDFHANITSRGYGYMRPSVEMTAHHTRCVEVTDPFGNRIRFNEKLEPDHSTAKNSAAD